MEIGLRQSCVLGFVNKFPSTSAVLKRNLEQRYGALFEESGNRPAEYNYELSVEYYGRDEEDSPIGEPVTAPDGRSLCETRSVFISGNYASRFGSPKIALFGLNITNPNSGAPNEEVVGIETLFAQIKSCPLDSVPKEITA